MDYCRNSLSYFDVKWIYYFHKHMSSICHLSPSFTHLFHWSRWFTALLYPSFTPLYPLFLFSAFFRKIRSMNYRKKAINILSYSFSSINLNILSLICLIVTTASINSCIYALFKTRGEQVALITSTQLIRWRVEILMCSSSISYYVIIIW